MLQLSTVRVAEPWTVGSVVAGLILAVALGLVVVSLVRRLFRDDGSDLS